MAFAHLQSCHSVVSIAFSPSDLAGFVPPMKDSLATPNSMLCNDEVYRAA